LDVSRNWAWMERWCCPFPVFSWMIGDQALAECFPFSF
jgi:hypothetical protein